ncbi:MAG: aminotransferase class V-fold PLP-dependent enzyme [Rhizobiaceae bacterium]|nr:MAG: aminotransferase class V-fold PLP-dependent enzyme [Rhizobiaceae bacterium]CAG0960869.1 alanine-glyoxylate transaminase / serine-glyoxylate transaminase / serine-pyruvate transaminase [Rhizobiaceae bacterium]
MLHSPSRPIGRHALQVPGPSPVPHAILQAISRPTIDHRGPEFQRLAIDALQGLKRVFSSSGPVVIYPASGTGAWEAALANTLQAGDRVLMVETGHFATLWCSLARKLGLEPEFLESDWRRGVEADRLEARLRADTAHAIKAVCVVHNETSTGCTSDVGAVRAALDAAAHPALLMVDTISSLASIAYDHDGLGVDVSIGCSQKGLMLPPGLSFNAISDKALAVSKTSGLNRSYWSWAEMLAFNADGFFPYTPSTNLLFGLVESIRMLEAEGFANVFARHARYAAATRAAVDAWGLEILCQRPEEYSPVLTAVLVPDGRDADELRRSILRTYDVSLGAGLGKLAGKVFRIGHLGEINETTCIGALAAVEMGLRINQVPSKQGGVDAAMDFLSSNPAPVSSLR